MKKTFKNLMAFAAVAMVSIGATYGTYSYLEYNHGYSSDVYNHGKDFDQENIHLAGITADGYPDFTKAAENSIHGVVNIKSTMKADPAMQQRRQQQMDPFESFFGFGDRSPQSYAEPQPAVGSGSGVIISADGYIITNNHVIDKANEIEVTLNDNSTYKAKLIGTDPDTDIALIKIEGENFKYVPFGDSDKLKVGEWVLAVGNPFNLTSTVTAGIVSAKGRGNIGSGGIQSFIQTDAAINPGNSGGALVNTDGQLIGINTAIFSQTGSFAGYGFAVPISIAGKVVADIKEHGAVQRAVLGVIISDVAAVKNAKEVPEKAKNIKVTEGVYINEFPEHSPALQAGIEEGDVIVAINDVKIRNTGELQEQISRYSPGDKVKVSIKRGDADKTFDVVLKNSAGNTSIVKKDDAFGSLGVAFKELSAETKKSFGITYGVEAAGIDSSGKFYKAGVSKGFIIQKANNIPISNQADLEKVVQSIMANKDVDKGLMISGFYPSNNARKYYVIDLAQE